MDIRTHGRTRGIHGNLRTLSSNSPDALLRLRPARIARGKRTGALLGPCFNSPPVVLPAPTPRRSRLLAKAVAAVDGPVPARAEGYLCVLTALSADGVVHFALAAVATAAAVAAAAVATVVAAAAGAPVLAAGRAALGLVCVALFAVVLLVVRAERERLVAVETR